MTSEVSKINATNSQNSSAPVAAAATKKQQPIFAGEVAEQGKGLEVEKTAEEKEAPKVLYLKNSTYEEFITAKFGSGPPALISTTVNLGGVLANGIDFLVERSKENQDFKKIASGELVGKQVFINGKDFKDAKEKDAENSKDMVYMRSSKGKLYVRDNGEFLGLDVKGEYLSANEKSILRHIQNSEKESLIAEKEEKQTRAKAEYEAAKAEAEMEYKQSLKDIDEIGLDIDVEEIVGKRIYRMREKEEPLEDRLEKIIDTFANEKDDPQISRLRERE